MAAPQNTYKSTDMVGLREDLSDVIYNIAPTETPFFSGMAKTRASNTLHEWQTDTLATPVDTNAHVEGDDTAALAASPTVRLNNQCQIAKKSIAVSGTQSAINKAGRGDEMAYQAEKRVKELKRDVEKSMFANKAKVARSDAVAGVMAGIGAWITTNTANVGGGGSDPTGDGSNARTDGSETALTQTDFNAVMKACWEQGGNPTRVFLSANQMDVATDFVGMNNARAQAKPGEVDDLLDIYRTNWGTVTFTPSRHIRDQDVFIADMSKWACATLRAQFSEKLGKTGDNEKRQIIWEGTLVSREEKASGLVADCS